MKKYSKKIALILVLALTLAFAIPALAADSQQKYGAGNTVVTGKYQQPKIEVWVPGNTEAVVNPYGLPTELKADSSNVIGKVKDSQIVTATPLVGFSMSEVDLDVGATVIGKPLGAFKLASAAPAEGTTSKTGFVYFEMRSVNDLGYTVTPDTTSIGCLDGAKILTELNSTTGWKTTYAADNPDQLAVSAKEATKNGMCTLKGIDPDTDTAPVADGYFVARLTGDIVKAPKEKWKATDGVQVTITWIIEPHEP